MQKYHDEPKQYKGYLKSALAAVPLAPNILTWDLTGGNRQVGVYPSLTSGMGR